MFYYWLTLVFVVGLIVGSFLNVAITRLPLEKSLIWPGSRCTACHEPIRWYDNLPLASYLWLRGRCRHCGARFSPQYFLVELFTGLAFAGLFYVEVVVNIHDWYDPTPWASQSGFYHWTFWAAFAYHACLLSLLIAASVTDLNGREIPLSLTLVGTMIGVAFAPLMPWPWPWTPALYPAGATPVAGPGVQAGLEWMDIHGGLREGVQPWPFWGPLPDFFAPGGNWQTGLATSVLGALAGTFIMRGIAYVFGAGLQKEALGLGDADLMMMVGAFLGWQIVLVSIFVATIPALVFGVLQLIVHRDNSLPFGPSLAAGVWMTYLGWQHRPAGLQIVLFSSLALGALAVFAVVFLFLSSVLIRTAKR